MPTRTSDLLPEFQTISSRSYLKAPPGCGEDTSNLLIRYVLLNLQRCLAHRRAFFLKELRNRWTKLRCPKPSSWSPVAPNPSPSRVPSFLNGTTFENSVFLCHLSTGFCQFHFLVTFQVDPLCPLTQPSTCAPSVSPWATTQVLLTGKPTSTRTVSYPFSTTLAEWSSQKINLIVGQQG